MKKLGKLPKIRIADDDLLTIMSQLPICVSDNDEKMAKKICTIFPDSVTLLPKKIKADRRKEVKKDTKKEIERIKEGKK